MFPGGPRLWCVGGLQAPLKPAPAGARVAPPRLGHAPIAVLLLLCATIAQQFKVKSPKHQSYYTTTIFFFAAATLFHPSYVVVIILAAHAVESLLIPTPWYIQAFNVADFPLSSLAAPAIFRL